MQSIQTVADDWLPLTCFQYLSNVKAAWWALRNTNQPTNLTSIIRFYLPGSGRGVCVREGVFNFGWLASLGGKRKKTNYTQPQTSKIVLKCVQSGRFKYSIAASFNKEWHGNPNKARCYQLYQLQESYQKWAVLYRISTYLTVLYISYPPLVPVHPLKWETSETIEFLRFTDQRRKKKYVKNLWIERWKLQ